MSHPARPNPAPPYRSSLPQPMNAAEILREHQDGAERVLAEHAAHLGVATFPEAHAHESLPFYRHRVQQAMRDWVRAAFADLVTFPGEEAMAQRMANGFAIAELGRTLGYFEMRQLASAVRDVLTSRWLELAVRRDEKIRGEEWLAEQREGSEP